MSINLKYIDNFFYFKNSNKRLFLSKFFYKNFGKNLLHFKKIEKNFNCTFCKSKKIDIYFESICKPEGNINFLSDNIFSKFFYRSIAKCGQCELIQEYNKLNISEFREFIFEMTKMDKNYAPENTFTDYPVPSDVKKKFFEKNYKKRFERWKNIIPNKNIENIFLIRPHFGLLSSYFSGENLNIFYNDFSKINKKVISVDFPHMQYLDGFTHHIFEGDFIKENFFDLIVVDHTLCHAFDLDNFLTKIKLILKKGGAVIFINEIQMKTHNPFHLNFFDEEMLKKILCNYFVVEEIRDCGYDNHKFINNFTKLNDNPDFVGFKN